MGHKGCDQQQELTIDFDIGYSIKVRRFGCLRGGAFYVTCLKAGTPALTRIYFLVQHTKPLFPALLSC